MVGAYWVIVQNKKIKFDFEIRRNITILRGDSATGKTTLVEMIQEYAELGPDSGIVLQCEKNCAVLSGRQWEKQLSALSQSIVFIDEGNAFPASKEFAAAIQKTDNYYVIVTRESLETLPYSVTEIYGIRTSKHFGDLKQTYNEFFQIYGKSMGTNTLKPTQVITEDSNISLTDVVVLVIRKNEGFQYAGYLIYIMAMYAFYNIITAVMNVVKYRKYRSPVMSAAKIVSLAAALVSMLSLETAMLTQFGSTDTEMSRRIMTACTGAGVCTMILAMAVYMIYHATRELKYARIEETK